MYTCLWLGIGWAILVHTYTLLTSLSLHFWPTILTSFSNNPLSIYRRSKTKYNKWNQAKRMEVHPHDLMYIFLRHIFIMSSITWQTLNLASYPIKSYHFTESKQNCYHVVYINALSFSYPENSSHSFPPHDFTRETTKR